MKIGFLFPGQGAQYVGMGRDLYNEYEEVRKIYEKANEMLKIDLNEITFNSNEEILGRTKNTQIAILVMSLGILEVLKKYGIEAEISAGLSLGEYTALIYSNMLSLEDGIRIVRKRGELMESLLPAGEWAMAAIIGLEDIEVEKACEEASKIGFVVPANYNCPKQIAISGERVAVLEAMRISKERGAKLALELKTGGPFHTTKLKEAAMALIKEIDSLEIKNTGKCKVVKNINAEMYNSEDDIKEILAKHIISPVRFKESIQTMLDNGVDTFVEIGPGKVLSGFVKKTDKSVKILNINDVETLKNVIKEISKE